MYLLRLVSCSLLVLLASGNHYDSQYYVFPDPLVEAFEPRGLRVSIPDNQGIQLFAFHGSINMNVENLEAGVISRDIVKKTGGRWVFEDKTVQLQVGDYLSFWLFVIRNGLGYRLDSQQYIVDTLLPQSNKKPHETTRRPQIGYIPRPTQMTLTGRPKCDPTPAPYHPVDNKYGSKPDTKDKECTCPPQPTVPCQTNTPTATTISNEVASTLVTIWAQSLVNVTEDNALLRRRVDDQTYLNDLLIKVVEDTNNPNIKKLKISGRISSETDPEEIVSSVLKEKLQIRDMIISAERNADNSIVFEMASFKSKLTVLLQAKEKLNKSRIIITDYLIDS